MWGTHRFFYIISQFGSWLLPPELLPSNPFSTFTSIMVIIGEV